MMGVIRRLRERWRVRRDRLDRLDQAAQAAHGHEPYITGGGWNEPYITGGGWSGDRFRDQEDDANRDEAVAELKEYRERQSYADNDATSAGKVCELCGSVITDGQPSRLRADGGWIHEACPISR